MVTEGSRETWQVVGVIVTLHFWAWTGHKKDDITIKYRKNEEEYRVFVADKYNFNNLI